MTLIEGIGDEVTHFFIGLIVVLIVSFAWWTTSISEQRHVQTVWLLDRRRHRAHRRLTNHTHTVTIAEGTETTALQTDSPAAAAETTVKPPEASTSNSDTSAADERSEDDERTRIVQAMDEDTCVLRQRRLAFYNRGGDSISENSGASESGSNATMRECLEEETEPETSPQEAPQTQNRIADDIRIKLKYINDDLKMVDGKLKEQLGDFKKRHFQGELSSNKLVRLIFNGQVLQQDTKTLEGCGLFDNCVVHCLIHQRRSTPGEESPQDGRGEQTQTNHNRNSNQNNNNNNNNQGRDWDLGNFLFAIISFTLLSAWYFRYVYAHLYTVTATVGLILLTGVFTIVIFGFYFPDHEHLAPQPPPRMENAETQSQT